MSLGLLSLFGPRGLDSPSRTTIPRSALPVVHRFRPLLEGLEDRMVPANLLTITDINLSRLGITDGVLTATGGTVEGTLAGLPFTSDISNFALQQVLDDPGTPAEECAVLNLELGPIDLDLLGLSVDTSAICLEVTATEGGGLLGDLLCGLADGLPLGNLPLLDGDGGLIDVVGDIIDGVLTGGINNAGDPPAGAEDICDGECEILDLALGPVDLSLLGLNVSLDDCEDGPVQVCVSASEGEGILGDLLCGLAGGEIPDLLPDLDLNLTQKDIDKLLKQATKLAADGELSLKDLGKLIHRFERLSRK